jgi:hypothetical protein
MATDGEPKTPPKAAGDSTSRWARTFALGPAQRDDIHLELDGEIAPDEVDPLG